MNNSTFNRLTFRTPPKAFASNLCNRLWISILLMTKICCWLNCFAFIGTLGLSKAFTSIARLLLPLLPDSTGFTVMIFGIDWLFSSREDFLNFGLNPKSYRTKLRVFSCSWISYKSSWNERKKKNIKRFFVKFEHVKSYWFRYHIENSQSAYPTLIHHAIRSQCEIIKYFDTRQEWKSQEKSSDASEGDEQVSPAE